MVNTPDTKLGRMFRQHIQYILDKNIDALLDQYTDDCVLISSFEKVPKYFRGKTQDNTLNSLWYGQSAMVSKRGLDVALEMAA